MAVTTENSTEYGYRASLSGYTLQEALDAGGKLRVQKFTFTQGAAAGDANSLVNLWKTPPGKVNIITALSQIFCSAFGAGRTLDIGYTAYTNNLGVAVIADVDGFADGLDVSGAAQLAWGLSPGIVQLNSQEGVVIQAKVLGDTIPASATLKGVIVYSMAD
jgi:hypothetical protein